MPLVRAVDHGFVEARSLHAVIRVVTTGARGAIARAPNHFEGAEILRDAE